MKMSKVMVGALVSGLIAGSVAQANDHKPAATPAPTKKEKAHKADKKKHAHGKDKASCKGACNAEDHKAKDAGHEAGEGHE